MCFIIAAAAMLAFLLKVPMSVLLSSLGGTLFGLAIAYSLQRWLNASPAPEVQGVAPLARDTSPGQPAVAAANAGVTGFDQDLLERVNSAAQAAGVRIFDWDLVGNRLTLDQTRLHVYAESARDVAADPHAFTRRIVHPDDLHHFQREMGKALKYKERFVLSYRALQNDGVSTRPVQLHGQVSRDANGRPMRVLGVTVDMSSQMEAAQRIEQQAAEQRLVLRRLDLATKAAGIGVWDWDVRNDRYTADAAIARANGLDELIVDSDVRSFFTRQVHADDRARFNEALDAALAQGDTFSHRYRVLLSNGKTRYIQIHSHIERDAEEVAARLLGVTMDVTAEVRRTEQLERQAFGERALRARLNLATQTASIGVWDMDVATGAINADEIACRLFGFEKQCDEATLIQLIHPDDRAEAVDGTRRRVAACEDGRIVSTRYRVMPPDRPIRHVQSHLLVSKDANGRPVRILGVTWDVTAELERAEELSTLR